MEVEYNYQIRCSHNIFYPQILYIIFFTFQRFVVTFSMLEIYNEQVRDLLSKEKPKGGLQVRQNPQKGQFYVQGLKAVPVGSYKEIEKRMEQGTYHFTALCLDY